MTASARFALLPVRCALIGMCLASSCAGADGLRPSRSGHFVTYRGRTVMLIGDSGTQVVPMNGDLDLRAWLDACRREGHSTVHVWAFTGARPGDGRLGSRTPLEPWARKPDGSFDLLRFADGTDPRRHYWARIRELCRLARERGLLVGITALFGWAKDHGPSPGWPHHPFNEAHGGPATRAADIVELAEDREIGGEAWDDAWQPRRKAQWLWERFALRLMRETARFDNVWFDYRDEWSYLNAEAGRAEAFWRRFFTSRGRIWADRTGEGGLRVANPDVPRFGPTPAIKTEGEPYEHDAVRAEVWRRAMSGIHYLLHNDAREPNIAAWDPGIAGRKGVAPADDLGRKYVGLCSRFVNRHVRDLDSLLPATDRAPDGVACMAGQAEVVAYVPAGRPEVAINMRGYGPIERVRLYDPRMGKLTTARARRTGDSLSIPLPEPASDWAVQVIAPAIATITEAR